MASSNKTPHYGLSQFAPTDKPAWQGDYNSDMKKIDNGIYAAQNKADSLDASVSEAENKATQALEKAEAAEDAAENAAALAQEAKTTADNISGDLSGKVNKAGDTMTGPLVLSGDPTQAMEAATKQYVDQHGGGASGDFLPLSGGTMTGPITLAADPTTAMQAATKQYADKMLPLAGGTMTGNLLLNGDPTQDNGAATKKYVDSHSASIEPSKQTISTGMVTGPSGAQLGIANGQVVIWGKVVVVIFTFTVNEAFTMQEGSLSTPNFVITFPTKFDTEGSSTFTNTNTGVGIVPPDTKPTAAKTQDIGSSVLIYNEGENGKIVINFTMPDDSGSVQIAKNEGLTCQYIGLIPS